MGGLQGWTVVALALLPHDIVLSYRAVARTGAIGINLKIVGMFIVLPLCLILWRKCTAPCVAVGWLTQTCPRSGVRVRWLHHRLRCAGAAVANGYGK